MLPLSLRSWLPAIFLSLPLAAAQKYEIFVPNGTDTKVLDSQICRLLPQQPVYQYVELSRTCHTVQEAQRQARAIQANVTVLPSLIISGADDTCIALPLTGLTEEEVHRTEKQLLSPSMKDEYKRRHFDALVFLVGARLSIENNLDDTELASMISTCQQLLSFNQATSEQKQFINLHYLYPMLMMQYTKGYNGAHTPKTEAKLLEAIAALETARDIAPLSPIGRQAHEERERLRAARIKSRQYE